MSRALIVAGLTPSVVIVTSSLVITTFSVQVPLTTMTMPGEFTRELIVCFGLLQSTATTASASAGSAHEANASATPPSTFRDVTLGFSLALSDPISATGAMRGVTVLGLIILSFLIG